MDKVSQCDRIRNELAIQLGRDATTDEAAAIFRGSAERNRQLEARALKMLKDPELRGLCHG